VKKNHFITVAGFVISILLLYFSMKDIQFHEILITLKKADYRLVLISMLFIFVAATLSAYKWSKITGNNVRLRETFVALFIGLFINNVLPARIGEIARGYVLSKKKGLSFTFAVSTVFVDRFFDLTGLLVITFLFFPRHSLPPRVSQAIYILIALLIVCIIMMIIMSKKNIANIIADKLTKIEKPLFIKFAKRIIEIQENLKRINSPLNLIFFVLILTLGISIKPFYIPFVCALLNMGLTVPSSPGYVGVYQFLLVYLLAIFNVPKSEGFTVSILYHATWYIPYNILGFLFLLKEHLKIKEIRSLEKRG
jgi:uncharacterized membrane protein YbhN (UPF0104 family)